MGPSCPLRIAHFDPAQEKKVHEADLQGYNFWTKSTTKPQKEAEDSQSKEKINQPSWHCCATNTVGYLSRPLK